MMTKNVLTKAKSLATLALLGLALALTGGPGTQAAATSYQLPFTPYSVGGYDFGQFVSGWGYHAGQDVSSGSGQPVYAIAEGTVGYSAKTPDSYRWGNLVMIEHSNPDGSKAVSLYGHLSADRRVAAGQVVQKGQLIGFVGPGYTADNGNWAAHLHFQIKYGAYGAPAGTYAPGMNGYVPAASLAGYAHPTGYINARNSLGTPPPPPPPVATWNHQGVQAAGSGTYARNQVFEIEFKTKNTGNQIWTRGGAHPFRLATTRPNDRHSTFSNGMGGRGWLSPNRIEMIADTPPGGIATFRAAMNAGAVPPGYYEEHFTPVVEGMKFLPENGLALGIRVNPPSYGVQWVGQSFHQLSNPTDRSNPVTADYLAPGKKINAKAYLKNVGDIPWKRGGNNPVRLGTTRPHDRVSSFAVGGDLSIPTSENWPALNRASEIDGRLEANGTVTLTDTVNPGETAVFSFTMKGIPSPGQFQEYFNPVVEGVGWMNDLAMWFGVRVPQPGYHYEYAGQTNPAGIALSKSTSSSSIDIRNSGQAEWPVGGNVRLGTDRGQDRASSFASQDWLNPNRPSVIDSNVTSPGKLTVAAGEVARFSFSLNNLTHSDGIYPEYLRPVVDGVGWMPEDYGIWVPVTVTSPAWDYQVISQKFDRDINRLRAGDMVTATLTIRNIGNESWKSEDASPVQLGTSRQQDRLSGFAQLVGADGWSSQNRASRIDGRVTSVNPLLSEVASEIKQGEIGLFTIPMKVPAVPHGLYNEYFNLVKDGPGGGWFPDYGIYFPLVVGP